MKENGGMYFNLHQTIYANLKNVKKENIPMVKDKFNESIKSEKLNFTPNDINYIIIKKESERDGSSTWA